MISVSKHVNYKTVSMQLTFGSIQSIHRNVAYHMHFSSRAKGIIQLRLDKFHCDSETLISKRTSQNPWLVCRAGSQQGKRTWSAHCFSGDGSTYQMGILMQCLQSSRPQILTLVFTKIKRSMKY